VESHLSKRAWVLQENILSPRQLTYTAEQLYWSCRTSERQEKHFSDLNDTLEEEHLNSHCYSRRILFAPSLGQGNLAPGSENLSQMLISSQFIQERSKDFLGKQFIVSNDYSQEIKILQF
jgi:hypothetical protein